MSEQQPVYAPSKKRYLGLWFVGGLVVVAVVIGVVFGQSPPPAPTSDHSLTPGLLGGADFPTTFRVVTKTQEDFDAALLAKVKVPATIEPTECSELVRGGIERGSKSLPMAVVEAGDTKNGIQYVEMIVRARDLPDWSSRRGEQTLATCGEMSYTTDAGSRITVHGTRVDGVTGGDGYATSMTTGPEYGIGGFTLAMAVTRVGDYLVQFAGIGAWTATGPALSEPEFVRLVNAANERVDTAL